MLQPVVLHRVVLHYVVLLRVVLNSVVMNKDVIGKVVIHSVLIHRVMFTLLLQKSTTADMSFHKIKKRKRIKHDNSQEKSSHEAEPQGRCLMTQKNCKKLRHFNYSCR